MLFRKIVCLLLTAVLLMSFVCVGVLADEPEPTTGETTETTVPEETVPGETTPEEGATGDENPGEGTAEGDNTENTPEEVPGRMVTSDEAVVILKAEEGFSSKPYWDYAQWTVGYGTKCPDDMLEYYKEHGITKEEAETLLRAFLVRFEDEIHKFMDRTGMELTQNQFDALLLFTYNCGSGWSYDTSGTFYNAIVRGATGNDLIYAFSRWSSAGGKVLTGLLRRRLCEANMYQNGVYSQTPPSNYGYVLYDACGGKTSPTVQGYDTALTSKILSKPTYDGYTFAGWYTEKTGGTKVELLDASVKNKRLYAHWVDAAGNEVTGETEGTTVTVTATGVNIRSGPGTDYTVIGSANKGDKFVITETATGSGYTWGKFSTGWICLTYTDYTPTQEENSNPEQTPPQEQEPEPEQTPPEQTQPEETKPAEPSTKKQMGTVKVSDFLRIRTGPSTGYDVAGYLNNGDRVEILEQKIVGSMIWGKIDKGWISLSYVTLDPAEPEPEPENKPEPETPEQKPQYVAAGTVKVNEFLRIRSGPSTSYALVDYLTNGTKVNILEIRDSEGMTWGKIDRGWISLDYVVLDKKNEEPAAVVTGTVKVNDFLRIRSGPGTSYAIAGYLDNGVKLQILEQKKVGITTWGRIESGWVSLDYIVLDNKQEEPSKVIKTVTADCLRIRINPGTGNTVVGYLYEGAKVEILETKKVDGMTWGKIENGWISMDYVK